MHIERRGDQCGLRLCFVLAFSFCSFRGLPIDCYVCSLFFWPESAVLIVCPSQFRIAQLSKMLRHRARQLYVSILSARAEKEVAEKEATPIDMLPPLRSRDLAGISYVAGVS